MTDKKVKESTKTLPQEIAADLEQAISDFPGKVNPASYRYVSDEQIARLVELQMARYKQQLLIVDEDVEYVGNQVADKLAVAVNGESYIHDTDIAGRVFQSMLIASALPNKGTNTVVNTPLKGVDSTKPLNVNNAPDEYKPTDPEIVEWIRRQNTEFTLDEARVAINDARSMHMISAS